MKILVTIPHYYKYDPQGNYGSSRERETGRIEVVRKTVLALRRLFSLPTAYSTGQEGEHGWEDRYFLYHPADTSFHYEVDIVICTRGKDHLLEKLDLPAGMFLQGVSEGVEDPMALGFACHQVLQSCFGEYDFYCYMEDDLVLHDEFFFQKLLWFEKQFGDACLLQPLRYQLGRREEFFKTYNDFELEETLMSEFRPTPAPLKAEYLGREISFIKSSNPHSGCFFLTPAQYERLLCAPSYGTVRQEFVTFLESAASLDISENLAVYKPSYENGAFLEIEHVGGYPADDFRVDAEEFRQQGYELKEV